MIDRNSWQRALGAFEKPSLVHARTIAGATGPASREEAWIRAERRGVECIAYAESPLLCGERRYGTVRWKTVPISEERRWKTQATADMLPLSARATTEGVTFAKDIWHLALEAFAQPCIVHFEYFVIL